MSIYQYFPDKGHIVYWNINERNAARNTFDMGIYTFIYVPSVGEWYCDFKGTFYNAGSLRVE